jgi:rhomboid protease GluP
MKPEYDKFRLIILPFIDRSLILVAGYAAVRLILDVHLDAAKSVTHEMWHIWMPVILAVLFSYFVIGNRFRLLSKEAKTERRREALWLVAIIALGFSMAGSQEFITSQSRTLSNVTLLADIGHPRANDCFTVSSPYTADVGKAGFFQESRRIPKRYGMDERELIIYAAVPLREASELLPFEMIPAGVPDRYIVGQSKRHTYWLVKVYTARVQHPTGTNMNREHKKLWERMSNDLSSNRFRRLDHLSVAPHSESSRAMLAAIENSSALAADDTVILVPEYSPFKKSLTGLWVSIGFYLAGLITISLIVLSLPAISKSSIKEFYARAAIPFTERLKFGRLALAIKKGAGVATWTLIGLNCAVFVAMLFAGISPISPSALELFEFGGATGETILGGERWRIATAMFLHDGVFHLVYNMLALFFVGMAVEPVVKPLKYLVIYLASGVGGALLSLLFVDPQVVHIGASGAIFGVMGVMMSLWARNRNKYSGYPTLFFMFGGISLLMGFLPGINNWAHIGGLATGFVLGMLLYVPPKKRRRSVSAKPAKP